MKKFTEIEQYRNVIHNVKAHWDYKGKDENGDAIILHDKPYPTLSFRVTCKCHGTNSSVCLYRGTENNPDYYEFQSRERVLSIKQDNAGFMLAMLNKPYQKLFDGIVFKDHCVIYGEWIGKGIQRGVAISQLPDKKFIIFAVKIDDVYQDMENYKHLQDNDNGIYNILQFPYEYIDIDFENPEYAQNKIVEMTLAVEDECPVGKYFNINGIGEGIVVEHQSDFGRLIFKSKGLKHSVSKTKTLAPVDTEALEGMKEFIEYAVTENRMQQGIDKMIEMNIPLQLKSTSDYLRWVYNDVVKEEQDTIIKNQIDMKKLGSAVSAKARIYWMNHLNSLPL